MGMEAMDTEPEYYRAKFDSLLNNSHLGTDRVYSCDINESAADIVGRGGLFSLNLLSECKGGDDLTIYDIFQRCSPKVLRQSSQEQKPMMLHKRSGNCFPFYVSDRMI
jgi:hypothetical protein